MDAQEYKARYFRPKKPLHLYAIVRLEPLDTRPNSPLSGMSRMSVISSSPCRQEMVDEIKAIHDRGDEDTWVMMEWMPIRGLRIDCVLNYHETANITSLPVTGDELRRLAERMAVLGVLMNLGCDPGNPYGAFSADEVEEYLSYR